MFTLKCCILNKSIDKTVDLYMQPNELMEQSILCAMFQLPTEKETKLGELSLRNIFHILLLNNKTVIHSKLYLLNKFLQHKMVWEFVFTKFGK